MLLISVSHVYPVELMVRLVRLLMDEIPYISPFTCGNFVTSPPFYRWHTFRTTDQSISFLPSLRRRRTRSATSTISASSGEYG